jgi:cytochrome c553
MRVASHDKVSRVVIMRCIASLSVAAVLIASANAEAGSWQTLSDGAATRAEYHWTMNCQGCHGANAEGSPGGAPPLPGHIGRFLTTGAGRAFLGRVPGVAFVALSDEDVADLLNWLVHRFDSTHVPKGFVPYSADEIRILRRSPVISDVYALRRAALSGARP